MAILDLDPPVRGRARVLAAALEMFAAQGFDRTTTRDIGRAAGITSPALYRHYATKDDLGIDLYRRCYAAMIDAVRRGCESAGTPIEKLSTYVVALTALYECEPLAMLFVDEHQLRFWPHVRAEFEPDTLSAMVRRWINDGRAEGSLRADVDPEAQIALVMGLVSQWCAMRRTGLAGAATAASLPLAMRNALANPTKGKRPR
jgi:AcrR family transcriptional regulator